MKRPTDLIGAVAELVANEDPRRAADRTLAFLVRLNGCRAGAVFSVSNGGEAKLYVGQSVDQTALDAVHGAWASSRAALVAGTPVKTEARDVGGIGFVLLPVEADGELAGLLYLDSDDPNFVRTVDLDSLSRFSRVLADALVESAVPTDRPATVSLEAYLEQTSTEEFARDRLLRMLEVNEWNIARVARLMGVTRPTIYQRLERYGIERRRVPKTLRPSPA